MRQEYVIEAYSPTLHQTIREFHLHKHTCISMHCEISATQHAESFAARLNQQQYLKVNDWQPKVTYQSLGIETLDGFIGLS